MGDEEGSRSRQAWPRRVGQWLNSTTVDSTAPTSPRQIRRSGWYLTALAVMFLALFAIDLPHTGWTRYVFLVAALAMATAAVRSWRSYRKLRTRLAGEPRTDQ